MLIGYARVSTADQDPALQLDALRAASCERVFEERASGARTDRPVLGEAVDYARDGDVLVVWRLDRFGRSLKDLIEKVGALRDRGVGFRSLTEAIDTTTAGGQLVFHIFGALAEFERELIRERTLAGLEAARARGRKGGRPPKMTRAKVRHAARLLADPEADVGAVCETLGVSKSTLYTYVGPKGEVRRLPDT
jgi:DNA invertase Pin-like site-specific DNA recombinase